MTGHILTVEFPTTALLLNSNDRGHCEHPRRIPEGQFHWWCPDCDLVFQAPKGGAA